MNSRLIAAAALSAALSAAVFGLAGCSASASPEATELATTAAPSASAASSDDCAGVTVVVDTGDLETPDDPSLSTCIETDAPILAADALAEAGIETTGTDQYGDQVVCRVNGVPAADLTITAADGTEYQETCATMPAAFAYWGLWTKPVDGEWGYAQEGLETLEVAPGEQVELLFTLNDSPAAPTS